MQSLFDGLRDRVKNPFVSAFVIAWLAVNWHRLFLMLMSAKTAETRVNAYSEVGFWEQILLIVLGPATIAIAYILGMPWVVLWINRKRETPEKLQRT